MKIQDATSRLQVLAALTGGDEELRQSINEALGDIQEQWENSIFAQGQDPAEVDDPFYILAGEPFLDFVIANVTEVDLESFRDEVAQALVNLAAKSGRRQRGPFKTERSGRRPFLAFPVQESASFQFPDDFVPEWAPFVSGDTARRFWKTLGHRITWDTQDKIAENFGYGQPQEVGEIIVSGEELNEWAFDLVNSVFSERADADPEAAAAIVIGTLRLQAPKIAARLEAAQLPQSEIISLGRGLFLREEIEEVVGDLEDYLDDLENASEPPEVITEITAADLASWGIRGGPLREEAPWRLVNLRVSDLRREGTLMRHCVGRADMGYAKALRNEEVELWSLRSRADKPRFTLEIDPAYFTEQAGPEDKAEGVLQLKGKANRTPGYAAKDASQITMPDEVIFWTRLFERLGVDPWGVEDFGAYKKWLAAGVGAWEAEPRANPRFSARSFDLPHRPAAHRRRFRRR